jgi:hypothetical protein
MVSMSRRIQVHRHLPKCNSNVKLLRYLRSKCDLIGRISEVFPIGCGGPLGLNIVLDSLASMLSAADLDPRLVSSAAVQTRSGL